MHPHPNPSPKERGNANTRKVARLYGHYIYTEILLFVILSLSEGSMLEMEGP